jgi:hypothetical protein
MPSSRPTRAPASPPAAPHRAYPSRDINAANAFAIRALSQPGSVAGPEKPYPGRDGTTTWNARDGSPPCDRGSVSGPIIPAGGHRAHPASYDLD